MREFNTFSTLKIRIPKMVFNELHKTHFGIDLSFSEANICSIITVRELLSVMLQQMVIEKKK